MTPQFNKWLRLGTPVFGMLVYGLFCYVEPQSTAFYQVYGWKAYLIDILACIIGSYVLFESSVWITQVLEQWLPWERNPLQRLLVQFIALLAVSSLAIWLMTELILQFVISDYTSSSYDEQSLRLSLVVGGLMTLFVNAVYMGEFFFQRWKTAVLDTEKLKRESVEARFEALRNQLDPHFLFNNLNTLIYLVEDNSAAVAFVEKLSLVYRYILQSRERMLVPLRDELMLANAYLFLLKYRYGSGVSVDIDVPESALDQQLPPMTLQLLLENAVKHNQVDPNDPLQITIKTSDSGRLVVENSIHFRQAVEGRTGIGLQNIRSRYLMLADMEPDIRQTAYLFTVNLPLLSHERVNHRR